MSDKVHLFKVEMTCESCAKAVSNILNKNKDKGIESFDIDLKEKLISIKSTLDSKAILEIIQKTGKSVTYLARAKRLPMSVCQKEITLGIGTVGP